MLKVADHLLMGVTIAMAQSIWRPGLRKGHRRRRQDNRRILHEGILVGSCQAKGKRRRQTVTSWSEAFPDSWRKQ